jgi:hypothetical protein
VMKIVLPVSFIFFSFALECYRCDVAPSNGCFARAGRC